MIEKWEMCGTNATLHVWVGGCTVQDTWSYGGCWYARITWKSWKEGRIAGAWPFLFFLFVLSSFFFFTLQVMIVSHVVLYVSNCMTSSTPYPDPYLITSLGLTTSPPGRLSRFLGPAERGKGRGETRRVCFLLVTDPELKGSHLSLFTRTPYSVHVNPFPR